YSGLLCHISPLVFGSALEQNIVSRLSPNLPAPGVSCHVASHVSPGVFEIGGSFGGGDSARVAGVLGSEPEWKAQCGQRRRGGQRLVGSDLDHGQSERKHCSAVRCG